MLTRLFAALLLVGLLPACSTTPSENEPLRLRVLTYNIQHARGADNTFDYQRLAEVIKRTEPDLVALQEVDVKTGRSSGVDQAAKLGKLTGMRPHFGQAMRYQGGGYGVALLSRWRYSDTNHVPLPSPQGHEPRVAAWSHLRPRGTRLSEIAFIGTHLCHQSEAVRLRQCLAINKRWDPSEVQPTSRRAVPEFWPPPVPTILAGDFNFTPDSKEYAAMLDAGWVDAAAAFGDPQPTAPADQPTRRIDYVFLRPANHWRVVDVRVLDEPVVSDHAPVLVALEYVWQ